MEVEIYSQEQYLKSDTDLVKYLHYAQSELGEWNTEHADHYNIVGFQEDGKYVAVGLGCVYTDKHCIRNTQWNFNENKHRELWIDTLYSKRKGYGHLILGELEKILFVHALSVERPNIYVRIKTNTGGYYVKQGYSEIWTPNHPDDNDGDTAVFQGEYGKWFARGYYKQVKDEEIMVYDTLSSLCDLFVQHRYQCIRDRIAIPSDVEDDQIWDFLSKQDKEYFKANFFKQTTDEDIEDLMMCF